MNVLRGPACQHLASRARGIPIEVRDTCEATHACVETAFPAGDAAPRRPGLACRTRQPRRFHAQRRRHARPAVRAHPRPDASPGRHRRAKARPTNRAGPRAGARSPTTRPRAPSASPPTKPARPRPNRPRWNIARPRAARAARPTSPTTTNAWRWCTAPPTGAGILMNSASAETKELAQSLAIETCEKGTGTSCKTFHTGCSYPVRFQ